MMIYAALFVVFFIVGLLTIVSPRRAFLIFIYLLALLPTSLAFGGMVVRGNIFYFEGFFVGCAISILLGRIKLYYNNNYVLNFTILSLFILACSAIMSAIVTNNFDSISSAVDFRLIAILIEIIIFYSLSVRIGGLSLNSVTDIVLAASISCLCLWSLNAYGVLSFDDVYYDEINRYRYKQVGTDLAAIYPIIYIYFSGKNGLILAPKSFLTLIASLLALAASGSRMLILCTLVGTVLAVNGPKQKILFVALFVLTLPLTLTIGSEIFSDGGVGLAALDDAGMDFYTRLSPADPYFFNMDSIKIIFGNGFGSYFIIPWFSYRGLRDDLGVIDTIHITMFVKFGALYIFLLFVYMYNIMCNIPSRLAFCIAIYFMLMGATVAFLYRPGFVLVAAILVSFGIHWRYQLDSPKNLDAAIDPDFRR